MKFSDFIKKLYCDSLFYLSVPKCVCCREILEKEDVALCTKCVAEYNNLKKWDCSFCKKPLYECLCTNDYLKAHYVKKLVKVFRYIHRDPLPTNNLIYSLKRDNREDVLAYLSNELCTAISASIKDPENYIFTSVPRRREAIRKYGIDHAALLAKRVAKLLGAEYIPLLRSKAKSAQKKMSGKERIENARFEYLKNTPDVSNKRIILVDDIVTTGSSMAGCAMLIRGLGAKEIVGAAISIAFRDSQDII